jgi:[protein-PII] uridylyltransferase
MLTPSPLSKPGSGAEALPDASRSELRRWLDQAYTELSAQLARGEDGLALGRRHAAMLDALVQRLHVDARARAGGAGVGLAAVGSWGRGAVARKSDADVRVIVAPRSDGREAAKFAEALLYPLWDAGVSVGHQVIDEDAVIELAQEDLSTATALLDMRHVAGEVSRVDALLARAWSGLFAEGELGTFVQRLEDETLTRHERFGASVYLLEPEVKSGAGGLRDLDGARWVARARFRVTDSAGSGVASVWQELVRLGVLVPREAQEIGAAEEFLWRVRNRLHAHAGRRSDRLTFDEQEAIAIELGYPAGASRAHAAEAFMQDYYLYARVVARARERIFERAVVHKRRPNEGAWAASPSMRETELAGGVRIFDGQVTLAGAAELALDPALALRVYAACVEHGAPVHPYARGVIARAAADGAWCEALRASREAADLFVRLVSSVAEARARRGSVIGEMHDVGLLLAMIPEFSPVTGRVHHDVYHVYTVDVHSVAAVDCLRSLARGELAHEHPVASRLAAEVARPRPLFLATLLHDVGKGYPDASGSRKNHSQSGAELCRHILPRLGLPPDDVAEAEALVAQHLAMYHVATRRDLDDPGTLEEFCRGVSGREMLRDLYLLTVADITTTSPTAMTSWKARMLEQLYIAADAHLARKEGRGADDVRSVAAREAARALWKGTGGASAFFDGFIDSMPERYLLANAPLAIVAHAAVARSRGRAPAHAAVVPSRHKEVAELCVVAEDRPGLLASIAAAITAGRMEVLAAQVYSRTRADGAVEAVDLFWVRDRVDGAEGVERGMDRLLSDLGDVCSGKVDPAELLQSRVGSASPWRERPSPAVPTEVVLEDRASPRHTVVEVFAKDRPGLLYTVARALHELGLSIALSKINTEGTKVADVFYVSELDGTKVVPGERFKHIREALVRAIEAR